jgi:methanogenic corrinoid protein MtbC1
VRRLTTNGKAARIHPDDIEHPSKHDIDVLCEAVLSVDPKISSEMMRGLQARRLNLDILFGRYLAPAAERLGEMWDQNRIDFMQVNLGVSRIFELMHKLRAALPPPRITKADPVIFATVPGEMHSLGVEMAAELFRQHGWDVEVLIDASHTEIMDTIGRSPFLVVGLSSSSRRTAEALALMVHAVRAAHPGIHIIISGQVVSQEPDLVALLEPDSAVTSVEEALSAMEQITQASHA